MGITGSRVIINKTDQTIIGVLGIDINSYYINYFLNQTTGDAGNWKSWIFESRNASNHAIVASSDFYVSVRGIFILYNHKKKI